MTHSVQYWSSSITCVITLFSSQTFAENGGEQGEQQPVLKQVSLWATTVM